MAAENSVPNEGEKAPLFNLPGSSGNLVRLSGLNGRWVVLYFYPKDDTPGCSTEAMAFRDALEDFAAIGAVVLGVSPDSVASHCRFIQKKQLNFELLADETHETAERYGVWVEKNLYGRKYMGVQRATFLIDPRGKIARVWPRVKPESHAAEVLETLRALTT